MTEINRERIEQLRRNHAGVYAAMQAYQHGMCSYTEALEVAVLMLASSEGEYKARLLDIMKREVPPPITMPIEKLCQNHCPRNHG